MVNTAICELKTFSPGCNGSFTESEQERLLYLIPSGTGRKSVFQCLFPPGQLPICGTDITEIRWSARGRENPARD